MSDWLNAHSNTEDEDAKRKQCVAATNHKIFPALMKEFEQRVQAYNGRNPPDFGFKPAVICSWRAAESPGSATISHSFFARVEKRTDPIGSLKLDSPINSGAINFERSSSGETNDGSITLDVDDKGRTTFTYNGRVHSTESIVEALLKPLLFPETFQHPELKIGFV